MTWEREVVSITADSQLAKPLSHGVLSVGMNDISVFQKANVCQSTITELDGITVDKTSHVLLPVRDETIIITIVNTRNHTFCLRV